MHPKGRSKVSVKAVHLASRSNVLPVFAPNMLGIASAAREYRVTADRHAFGKEDGVGKAVRDAREPVYAAFIPILIPTPAEYMPIGGIGGCSTTVAGPTIASQGRAPRSLEGLD